MRTIVTTGVIAAVVYLGMKHFEARGKGTALGARLRAA